jgi:RNase P subunit RPR2
MKTQKILLKEVLERGAYCKKCKSKLELTFNSNLKDEAELVTFCKKCKHITRTLLYI